MNSVENTIKGKWILISVTDTIVNNGLITSEIHSFPARDRYLNLLTSRSQDYAGHPSAKDATDQGVSLKYKGWNLPVGNPVSNFWYYSETDNLFHFEDMTYKPVKISSSELILAKDLGSTITYTFLFQR